ncbi:MAG: GGDEF domain-containing protein [Chromatiales bacterium]|nr:MAG: GGDEF domain-containing protein [Chromatiales bacterium]
MTTHHDTHKLPFHEVGEDPRWIPRQQLQLLCRNTLPALGGTAACGAAAVLLLWPAAPGDGLLLWLGVVMALILARLLLQQRYTRHPETHDPWVWRNRFAGGVFVSGATWGALSVFLFPADSLVHQLYLAFVLGGLCAGAVTAYSPLPHGFLLFALPALAPFLVRMMATGSYPEQVLALLVAVFALVMSRIAGQSGDMLHGILELQAENARLARALHHQATHDSLVDLTNHREFQRRLERLTEQREEPGPEFCLVFIDLDLFKVVNDSGGHAAGDAMLQAVARILRAHTRARDTAARIGGDEFALLLEGCPAERALEIAEHVRRDIANLQLEFEDQVFSIGASIGLTYGRAGAQSASSVLKAADAACYAAKEGGRNRVRMLPADDMFKTTGRFSLDRLTKTA